MRANLNSQTLVAFIIAASLASTIGGLLFNTLPVLLGSLADSFQLPPQQIGLLGSICFGGYLLGTLGAPLWMNRLNWRWFTAIGAVCTAQCFALSAWVQALLWEFASCCRPPKLRAPIHRDGPSCWCPARLHWPPWWALAWRASSWEHRVWSLFCGLHWLPARCLC